VQVPPCQHGQPRCCDENSGSGGNSRATPHKAWVSPFVHDSRHSRISLVVETSQRQLKSVPKKDTGFGPEL
jgi:hypothetical protein